MNRRHLPADSEVLSTEDVCPREYVEQCKKRISYRMQDEIGKRAAMAKTPVAIEWLGFEVFDLSQWSLRGDCEVRLTVLFRNIPTIDMELYRMPPVDLTFPPRPLTLWGRLKNWWNKDMQDIITCQEIKRTGRTTNNSKPSGSSR